MIAFVKGILDEKSPDRAVVEAAGVGYEIAIPVSTFDALPPVGKPVRLETVHVVREDAQLLFGFASSAERATFLLLTSVNGIGPKIALALLSALSVTELRAAVARNDAKLIASVPGIGKKSAERILLELRDKLPKGDLAEAQSALEHPSAPPAVRDALQALVSLGYKLPDAQALYRECAPSLPENASTEVIIRTLLAHR